MSVVTTAMASRCAAGRGGAASAGSGSGGGGGEPGEHGLVGPEAQGVAVALELPDAEEAVVEGDDVGAILRVESVVGAGGEGEDEGEDFEWDLRARAAFRRRFAAERGREAA